MVSNKPASPWGISGRGSLLHKPLKAPGICNFQNPHQRLRNFQREGRNFEGQSSSVLLSAKCSVAEGSCGLTADDQSFRSASSGFGMVMSRSHMH